MPVSLVAIVLLAWRGASNAGRDAVARARPIARRCAARDARRSQSRSGCSSTGRTPNVARTRSATSSSTWPSCDRPRSPLLPFRDLSLVGFDHTYVQSAPALIGAALERAVRASTRSSSSPRRCPHACSRRSRSGSARSSGEVRCDRGTSRARRLRVSDLVEREPTRDTGGAGCVQPAGRLRCLPGSLDRRSRRRSARADEGRRTAWPARPPGRHRSRPAGQASRRSSPSSRLSRWPSSRCWPPTG